MSKQPKSLNPVIADTPGRKIFANPSTYEVFEKLEKSANQGNHYAQVAVKELRSLQSGAAKNNVFISAAPVKHRLQSLTVILPGCSAKVLQRADGNFFVYHIEPDSSYEEVKSSRTQTGLYDVQKQRGEWNAKKINNGEIKEHTNLPIVAISDGAKSPVDAAPICASHAATAENGGQHSVEKRGFNMHFHKGAKIGGLMRMDQALGAESCPELHTSALLLASTMEKSSNIPDVSWITQAGGSGVMTQALRILRDKKVSLEGSGHSVYFSAVTTNLRNVENLAREVGLEFPRKSHSADKFNFNQLVGGLNFFGDFISALKRKRHDPHYSALQMGSDITQSVGSSWKTAVTISSTSAAVAIALGSGGTAATIPAGIAICSAIWGTGKTLTKAWLPEHYRKLVSKL